MTGQAAAASDPLPGPVWAALPPRRRSTTGDIVVFGCAMVAILVVGGTLWAVVGRFTSGHIPAPANAIAAGSNSGPKLLIRLDVGQDYGPGDSGITSQHVADYLSDGTVIRVNSPANSNLPYPVPPGILERNTLSPTGLATLRALLAKDADLLGQPTDITHWGDTIIDTFVLERPDGSRYTVTAPDIDSPYADKTWLPDPATARLAALAKALADPATMAGAGGLISPTWTPYLPEKMAAFVLILPIEGKYDPTGINPHNEPDLSDVRWPFQGDPDTFGGAFSDTSHRGLFGRATTRCAFLPSADVESGIAGLTYAGFDQFATEQIASGTYFESGIFRWSARSDTTGVMLIALALLPEDVATSCADAISY